MNFTQMRRCLAKNPIEHSVGLRRYRNFHAGHQELRRSVSDKQAGPRLPDQTSAPRSELLRSRDFIQGRPHEISLDDVGTVVLPNISRNFSCVTCAAARASAQVSVREHAGAGTASFEHLNIAVRASGLCPFQ